MIPDSAFLTNNCYDCEKTGILSLQQPIEITKERCQLWGPDLVHAVAFSP